LSLGKQYFLRGMHRIRLVCWQPSEARDKGEHLKGFGHDVSYDVLNPRTLREIRDHPPDVVVIDLSRLPSQGRDIGLAIRLYKSTHGLPIVFTDGDPAKVEQVRLRLPDALYSTWDNVKDALETALTSPPEVTTMPATMLDGYSGAPLQKKLGLVEGLRVAILDAPEGFTETLGSLPDKTIIRTGIDSESQLVIWFVKTIERLDAGIRSIVREAPESRLWIVWPKKGKGVETDLTQARVRKAGLSAGLVDYKVSRIDDTWAGLLFTRRKHQTGKDAW